jgi:Domain of unknown function (DUF4276)
VGEERGGREAFALIRLHVLAEGQTEESFVNEVLAPELGAHDIFADAHRITTGRRHGRLFRGGLTDYEHLARDLILWMKQDQHQESWFTTMIDLYRLPINFPGRGSVPLTVAAHDRVARLEAELSKDMIARLSDLPVSRRLIPYIQLHEFEALLFSDPSAFLEAYPGNQMAVERLKAIRAQFHSPEEIDETPGGAPSKRILGVLPDYQKPVAGLLVAQRIGLAEIRRECRHFNDWLTRLLQQKANWAVPGASAFDHFHPCPIVCKRSQKGCEIGRSASNCSKRGRPPLESEQCRQN